MRSSMLLTTCAVLAAMPTVARADLVLFNGMPSNSIAQVTGLPSTPVLLSLQNLANEGPEVGMSTPIDVGTTSEGKIGGAGVETPMLSDPTLGWTAGDLVGIGFNANQSGGSGITLNSLTLTIFNQTSLSAFSTVASFPLASSPIQFLATDVATAGPGSGTGTFNFVLSGPEQTAFNVLLAMPGSANFLVGLSASLGCGPGVNTAPDCMNANAGQELFHGFSQTQSDLGPAPPPPEIALPASLPLFATGLVSVGLLAWRRKRKSPASVLARNLPVPQIPRPCHGTSQLVSGLSSTA